MKFQSFSSCNFVIILLWSISILVVFSHPYFLMCSCHLSGTVVQIKLWFLDFLCPWGILLIKLLQVPLYCIIHTTLSHPSCFSPVIKVGRATDEEEDKETVLSESDDEAQQNRTFVNNRRVKSNLFWAMYLLVQWILAEISLVLYKPDTLSKFLSLEKY